MEFGVYRFYCLICILVMFIRDFCYLFDMRLWISLLLLVFLIGCSAEQPAMEVDEVYDPLLGITDIGGCMQFFNETISGEIAQNHTEYVHADNYLLMRDFCIFIFVNENLNDETILFCDNVSLSTYTFVENVTYQVSASEFCYRTAFDELRSSPRPPTSGDIMNKSTCDSISSGKDNCNWIVAMNGDMSACMRMSSFSNMQVCRREFELPAIIAQAEAQLNVSENDSLMNESN